MSEDHTELSQDQIKLVEAFEAAASYFAARIVNEAEIDPGLETKTIEEIVDSTGVEQANSKISDEAGRRYSMAMGENPENLDAGLLNCIKRGGLHPEGGYFVGEAVEVFAPRKLKKLSDECKKAVMKNVLDSDVAITNLPESYRAELKNRYGAQLPHHKP